MAASARKPPATSSRTLLYVGAALAVALLVFLLVRSRTAGATLDTSGTPGPDRTGSAADLAPTGGAASVPGNLPPFLVSQPDQLQQQVQATDAGGQTVSTAPTASSSYYSYVNPYPGQTQPTSVLVGSTYLTQSAPGSDYLIAEPTSHPALIAAPSQLPATVATGDVRRPGFQPNA